MLGSRLIRVLSAAAFIAAMTFAQEFRGTITGRVLDAQQAAVPGAKLSVTLLNTGARSDTTSSSDGSFTIPFLTPGVYKITAEAAGFKRYQRDNFSVGSGEREGVDIVLEIGQLTETVNVTAEASLLETATASAGQVISG